MLGEASGHLHQAALEGSLRLGDVVPGRHGWIAWGELGFLGNPAHLLGPVKDSFPIGVPPVIELALVLVGPLLHDVVWSVQTPAGPVHEERLVGLERLMAMEPADGVVGQVLAEVVALLWALRRGDDRGVADQVWLELRCLSGEEAVEVLEAVSRRPVVEWSRSRRLQGRGVVPLPKGRGGVAVVLQHLGGQRTALGDFARVAVPVVGQLGNLPISDAMVIATGQQRGAGRRAHRRRMKSVVADAFTEDPGECVGPDLAPERGG